MTKRPKIIAVVGPTATGKSKIAVEIAKRFDGEVISADSRQVYRGLDIGTEKITQEEMRGIPHHLINVIEPTETYSVQQFKQDATKSVRYIEQKGRVPIIAGGTGWYIEALVDDHELPDVPPNEQLRTELEPLTAEQLLQKLQTLDPARAQTIDPYNKRRLVRAIEIATALGEVPEHTTSESAYHTLWIGLTLPDEELRGRIEKRLGETLERGLVQEVRQIRTQVPESRFREFGLEYRIVAEYLDGSLAEEEMKTKLVEKLWQYAKRQKTWFRRNDRIQWFHPDQKEQILATVADFLI